MIVVVIIAVIVMSEIGILLLMPASLGRPLKYLIFSLMALIRDPIS